VAAIAVLGCSKSPTTLEQECFSGGAPSCIALGNTYLAGGGVARDAAKTAMLFERACEARDAPSCDKARQLYRENCDKGVAGACSLLGRMYLEGFGASEDHPKAAAIWAMRWIAQTSP
jgi:TPR repeat protein